MLDARLFNREQYSASFGSEDSYNLYDKPLFSGSSAAAAIYKPRGRNVDDEGYEVDAQEVEKAMKNDRFGLGIAGKGRGFEGADTSEIREGCVRRVSPVFGRVTDPTFSTVPSPLSATRPILSASTPSSSRPSRERRARARRSAGSTRATTAAASGRATTELYSFCVTSSLPLSIRFDSVQS